MTNKELALLTTETQRMLIKVERMGYTLFLKGLNNLGSRINGTTFDPYIVLGLLDRLVTPELFKPYYDTFAINASKKLIPQNLKLIIKNLEGKFKKDRITDVAIGFRNEQMIAQVTRIANSVDVAEKVDNVTKYTKQLIAKAIREGLAQNKTKEQIARDIKKITNGQISKMRALRIARTETTYINSQSTKILSDTIPFKQEKRWIPRLDGRERAEHGAMSGKKPIPKSELFIVGGYQMEYPSDPRYGAGAEQIVNCRCAVHYMPIQDDEVVYETELPVSQQPAQKPNILSYLKSLLSIISAMEFFK